MSYCSLKFKRKLFTIFPALVFFIIYVAVFSPSFKGIGNFWDWGTPFFRNHFQNISNNYSWQDSNLGSSTGYVADLFYTHVIYLLNYIRFQTEMIIYSTIILSLALFSYFFYVSVGKAAINRYFAYLLGMSVVLCPAIFYKLLAGHLTYLVSLVIFLGLIYFMLAKFKKNFFSYILLITILSFVGAQIQFFVFAAIFLLIYFLFNREKFSWKYCWLLIIIPFLINLPWLSNFLVGANSVSATSQGAIQMLFADSAFASPMRIFFMIFSPATDIQYAYDRWMLIYFGIFTVMVYGSIAYYYARIRNKELGIKGLANRKIIDVLTVNLVVFTLLGTGYFQKIPIPLIKTFYPMFRESGHFAPIIVLFEILTFAFTWPFVRDGIVGFFQNHESRIKNQGEGTHNSLFIIHNSSTKIRKILECGLCLYLLIFVGINAYTFYKYLPRVNFAEAREKFQPFEYFGATDNSVYRVLTYPFWDEYGLNNVPDVAKNGKLLNNSGWGTFVDNSGKENISNYQAGGQSINDTLQYRLLTTENITELEQKNVKYIYDLQNIYTSNWNLYTSPDTYDNNLSLIKNNPNFMAKLMAANPGEITKVADHIYEINNTLPRVYIQNQELGIKNNAEPQASFIKINPTKYKITIKNLKNTADLNFLESYHLDWKIYLGNYYLFSKPLFNSTHKEILDYANGWTINKADIINQGNKNYAVNSDGSINVDLTLYFWPQTAFEVALVLSILTILSCATYLMYAKKRRK